MTAFNEKKEADLSGKKNSTPRSGRKPPATDRKGKGKEKVNGHAETKQENGSDIAEENGEKEETPEA
jgi:hypothetical protein